MIEIDEKYLWIGDGLRVAGRYARKTFIVIFAIFGVLLSLDYMKKVDAPEFIAAEKAYRDRCYEPRVAKSGKPVPPKIKDECR